MPLLEFKLPYFNSIKVRLELRIVRILNLFVLHFNSIKVRLELQEPPRAAKALSISIP